MSDYIKGAVVFNVEPARALTLLCTLRGRLPEKTLQIYALIMRICGEDRTDLATMERLGEMRARLIELKVRTTADANAYISDVEAALGFANTPRQSEEDSA